MSLRNTQNLGLFFLSVGLLARLHKSYERIWPTFSGKVRLPLPNKANICRTFLRSVREFVSCHLKMGRQAIEKSKRD